MANLLKEAIADAKAVRAIAEKSAISTLTEAFAPQMQSMLSRRIAEEGMEDEEDDTEPAYEPTPPPAAPPAEEMPPAAPEMEDEEDVDLDEVLAELEGDTEMEEEPIEEAEDDFNFEDEEEPVDESTIDEILQEVEDELDAPAEDDEEMSSPTPTMENRQLKRKLKEAYKVISSQKSILNEVGVLNAKLLYTTKILGKYSLTEAQKMKVLEAFDRCDNLKETKIVYVTMAGNFSKRSDKPGRKITEGAASKAVKSIAKPINENVFVNKERWQKLAGL